MTFISIAFVVFFVAIVVAYYLCPQRYRWALLLLGSCYFYAAFVPKYIFVLFFIILVSFILAKQIEQSSGKKKQVLFIASVFLTIGVLFIFKYFNFFNENVGALASALNWNYSIESLSILLPLGLSFHTFQTISYLIEVYRGNYPAERHLGHYSLYVMFFPQLVAGPIERPSHLLPQFKKVVSFDKNNIFSGLRLMAWGFFKKIVIADRLAVSVNYIYANITDVSGPSIIFAMLIFSLQLYADFSGYTDIARGSARVLGIDLVRNFNQPYFSRSISEFWRRWHISLYSWFRDYVYIPLGGNREGKYKQYRNIIIVFAIMGFWHGAAWTFIIMGLLFGLYIVVGRLTEEMRERFVINIRLNRLSRLRAMLQMFITFVLVNIGWVFFRSPDIPTVIAFFKQAFVGWGIPFAQFVEMYVVHPMSNIGMRSSELGISVAVLAVLFFVENLERRGRLNEFLNKQPLFVLSVLYSSIIFAIVLLGMFTASTFIYFQF